MTESVKREGPDVLLGTSEEQAVLQRCLVGDWSEYGQIVRRYKRMVWAALDAVVSDKPAIPDLVQETFIRVYEKLHTYRSDALFSSWLYRVARNVGLNHNRRISRRPQTSSLEMQREVSRRPDPHADSVPEQRHSEESKQQALERMVLQLDERYRTALNMHYGSDLSYSEVATAMGVPLNTVRTWLKRGREQLLQIAIKEGWQ